MLHAEKNGNGGFSLVEVVIAVGLFALSILAVVGLLGPILESIRESEETEIVSNLNELIRAELERMPFEDPGATIDIANFFGLAGGDDADTVVLYGNRELSMIMAEEAGDFENEFPPPERFFRIELRESPAFPFDESNPGQYTSRTLQTVVYWPAYRRTGPGDSPQDAVRRDENPEDRAELRQMTFFTTIRRK